MCLNQSNASTSAINILSLILSRNTLLLVSSKVNDEGSSQNLMLFIRGNVISGTLNINGTNQFPTPPPQL